MAGAVILDGDGPETMCGINQGLSILRLNCDFSDSMISMIGKSCQSINPINHSSDICVEIRKQSAA